MIVAINYSDDNYKFQQEYNTKTAYKVGGVDKVIEYSPQDIDVDFYKKNAAIFAYKRGAGLWLWKPYIIYKTLQTMEDNDYLFYCDAGVYYVNKVNRLIDVMEKKKVPLMTFELPLLEREWTKKETFDVMDYHQYDNNQICATYILMKNCEASKKIIAEWLFYMQDERCASPKQCTEEPNFDDFVEHREDQSVFSVVCHKYNIVPFRDPSQYGDRPYQYAWMKSYNGRWKEWTYNEKKYQNSLYPRIVVSNRSTVPSKYKRREMFRNLLCRLGLYKCYFKYKSGAKF